MRLFRFAASALIALTAGLAAARADTPQQAPSPLRFLPNKADLLVEVRQPARLVETLAALDSLKQLQQLAPVRELFDSTNARRFAQLVAYFEKELGASWPRLLERLAGRGAVLGVQFGPNPAPVLLVIEGTDEDLMGKFFQLGRTILEQELARQEAKEKPVAESYEGIETLRVGTQFYSARAGAVLFLSNNEKTLKAGLDRFRESGKKSMADVAAVAESARLLPPDPLLSAWLNMKTVRQSPEAKAAYKSPPRDDPNLTVLLGHYLDLLGRSPFVCAGLYRGKNGFETTIRVPRGREGMGEDRLLHVPPAAQPGSRPLLEPKNVLYSESNYLDVSMIWKERAKLFNEKQVQGLERFDKQSAPFMVGAKLSKLLTQAGPYYRFVAAHQAESGYKAKPKIAIPSFALVWELREPEAFGKSMETILRGAALLAGAQADLKLAEETYHDYKLVGYRFPDGKPLKGDVNDLRFNFSPCFTRVGNQFVASSTIELGRELVDILHKEGTDPMRGDASPTQTRLYGSGAAAYLQTIEDLLITRATLDQAVTPQEAREQVRLALEWLRQLGALSLSSRLENRTSRYDIHLRPEK